MTAICLPCGQALEEAAAQAAEEERRRLQTQTELQDRYRMDLEKEKLVRLSLSGVSLHVCWSKQKISVILSRFLLQRSSVYSLNVTFPSFPFENSDWLLKLFYIHNLIIHKHLRGASNSSDNEHNSLNPTVMSSFRTTY